MKSPAPLKKKNLVAFFFFMCLFRCKSFGSGSAEGIQSRGSEFRNVRAHHPAECSGRPSAVQPPRLPGLWTVHCSLGFDSSHGARATQAVHVCFPPGSSCWPLCPPVLEAAWAPGAGSSPVSLAGLCVCPRGQGSPQSWRRPCRELGKTSEVSSESSSPDE